VRKLFFWKLRQREIKLGERTVLMGVLNLTPDSFSDGGRYSEPDRAFARALELEELGADIVDIGAESTRPGSARISAAEEIRRLIPVLKRLKGQLGVPISVDTYKAEVAERALELRVESAEDLEVRLRPGDAINRLVALDDPGERRTERGFERRHREPHRLVVGRRDAPDLLGR